MKTAYTPDNTRTSLLILVSIAVVVIAAVALVGLSDKPDVRTIVIGAPGELAVAPAASIGFGATDDAAGGSESDEAGGVLLDEFGEPFDDALTGDADSSDADGSDADESSRTVPEGQIIVVPTTEPTPTPEVAAAVQPTPAGRATGDASQATSSVQAAPSLPTSSGTVQGSFFTKGDENDGAVVSQNLITLSFAEDGSGAFQGVLDITYADDTHILLNMSGPLTWAPTNPQVEATLTGAFTLDAPIDTDDVTTSDADLSISSLEAGSGSLCTTKCFGFTFPPQ